MSPVWMPSFSAAAVDLEHGADRIAGGDGGRREGIVRSTIRRICPSAPMNSMSSGISVFFIQKATGCSLG